MQKKLQTDPNGATNGYGEKTGNPFFLYCNRSVGKRVLCACVRILEIKGKWKPWRQNRDKAEIMINPSGKGWKKKEEQNQKKNLLYSTIHDLKF
jgi:hypothetical protein